MANISNYLGAILSAVYGEEVRSSIYDALNVINESASEAAEKAIEESEEALKIYTNASNLASEALRNAEACIPAAQQASKDAEIARKAAEEVANAIKAAGVNDMLLSEFLGLLIGYSEDAYDNPVTDSNGGVIIDSAGDVIIDSAGDVKDAIRKFIKLMSGWVQENVKDGTRIIMGDYPIHRNYTDIDFYAEISKFPECNVNDIYINNKTFNVYLCTTVDSATRNYYFRLQGCIKGNDGSKIFLGGDLISYKRNLFTDIKVEHTEFNGAEFGISEIIPDVKQGDVYINPSNLKTYVYYTLINEQSSMMWLYVGEVNNILKNAYCLLPEDGFSGYNVGDVYIDTSSGDIYECVGSYIHTDGSTFVFELKGTFKGPKGDPGKDVSLDDAVAAISKATWSIDDDGNLWMETPDD